MRIRDHKRWGWWLPRVVEMVDYEGGESCPGGGLKLITCLSLIVSCFPYLGDDDTDVSIGVASGDLIRDFGVAEWQSCPESGERGGVGRGGEYG